MIYLKTKAVGLDIPIQALQNSLYVQLKKVWNLTDNDLKGYGRVYRNQTKDGYIPEAYLGNSEYTDTFFDDRIKANFCFFAGETQKYNGGLIANVSVIFSVNLQAIKPTYTWRADEEARLDVELFLHSPRQGFKFLSMETGTSNVWREFPGWDQGKGIQYLDMYPFHCFRINLVTDYSVSIC